MKHIFLDELAVVPGVLLALATCSAAADTKTAPYYAMPAWDQQLLASTRFVVLPNWIDENFPSGGAAVLDHETGLVWERSPSTSLLDWYDAQFRCNNLRVGNRLGWKLPTTQELASLVDPTIASPGPTLPAGHPFTNVQQEIYWSATTTSYAPDSSEAWVVSFYNGSTGGGFGKSVGLPVWCVRGGQGVDPQ